MMQIYAPAVVNYDASIVISYATNSVVAGVVIFMIITRFITRTTVLFVYRNRKPHIKVEISFCGNLTFDEFFLSMSQN